MRIIGGKYNRRRFSPPSNVCARPTTDLAKESIFNIINNHFDFHTITVLDLFAGTGNISYEFASRGAIEVYAVDIEYNNVKFIKKQAERFPFPEIKAVREDVHHFLSICRKKFDIIFADPPYKHKKIPDIHKQVFEKELLNDNGWLIIEHSAEIRFIGSEFFIESRKFGRVNFSIFTKQRYK